jgi:glycolate oxidase
MELSEKIIDALKEIVGKDNVLTIRESLETYSHDETPGLSHLPDVVVKPKTAQEISKIMKLANKEEIPVTPRGGGTGLSGGAVPWLGGILMSFERMNQIKEIDTKNSMAVVEAGVIAQSLEDEAAKYGLFYPPDPASLDSCMIAGNVAECAGGPRTFKYGVTRDYVKGMEAVLPQGEIIRMGGKLIKNVTGYSLMHLIVGSEGTLAIVTEVTLKLLPLPEAKIDLLIPFNSLEQSVDTAVKIIRSGIAPATIEFMEREAIKASEKYLEKKTPFSDAEVHILVELDGKKENIQKEYEVLGELALENGAIDVYVAEDKGEQDRVWEARRAISEALKSKSEIDHEDTVVPTSEIPNLIKNLKELEKKYGLKIVCYGHIGDGNIHVNALKENMADKEWREKVPKLVKEIFDTVMQLGGMISGEHGIGLAKKAYLPLALDRAQIELMKRIKKTFDPKNILNPGKIFDI